MPTDLIHRGVWYEQRTTVDDPLGKREKTFADAWQKENEPRNRSVSPIGSPMSTLQALMLDGDRFIPVSQETATAVATVVQWLATPVGWSFLEGTLREAGYIVHTREDWEKRRGPHG